MTVRRVAGVTVVRIVGSGFVGVEDFGCIIVDVLTW